MILLSILRWCFVSREPRKQEKLTAMRDRWDLYARAVAHRIKTDYQREPIKQRDIQLHNGGAGVIIQYQFDLFRSVDLLRISVDIFSRAFLSSVRSHEIISFPSRFVVLLYLESLRFLDKSTIRDSSEDSARLWLSRFFASSLRLEMDRNRSVFRWPKFTRARARIS